jgi:hypothetical protein
MEAIVQLPSGDAEGLIHCGREGLVPRMIEVRTVAVTAVGRL